MKDPFIKISLYKNGKKIIKKKSTVKWHTLNAYYNQAFTFKINEKDLNVRFNLKIYLLFNECCLIVYFYFIISTLIL